MNTPTNAKRKLINLETQTPQHHSKSPPTKKTQNKPTRVHRQGGRLQGQGRGRDRGSVGERLLRDARVGEDLRLGQGTLDVRFQVFVSVDAVSIYVWCCVCTTAAS